MSVMIDVTALTGWYVEETWNGEPNGQTWIAPQSFSDTKAWVDKEAAVRAEHGMPGNVWTLKIRYESGPAVRVET
jgi:hypothetical protein